MTSEHVELALQRLLHQSITGLKHSSQRIWRSSVLTANSTETDAATLGIRWLSCALGPTQDGNHHALQEHELQSTRFSFALHTSPTKRERASGILDIPETQTIRNFLSLRTIVDSLRKEGEKAQPSVKLQKSLQILRGRWELCASQHLLQNTSISSEKMKGLQH